MGLQAFGAWTGFPVFDDAYLVLFLREAGVGALEAQHPHRPLFGLLLKWTCEAFGLRRGPYVALTVSCWALLAWQASRLSRRLRPNAPGIALLSVLLVLSPILVVTQYTGATTVLPANLPVSLVLAATLWCLADERGARHGAIWAAAALTAAAVLLSEYGIAAAAAGIALLAVLRRYRAAGALVVGTVAGYAAFRLQADLSVRAKQSPGEQLGILAGHPHLAVLRFLEGLWRCLVGAWASAAGSLRLSVSDRSTLLAAFYGILAALAVWLVYRGSDGAEPRPDERRAAAGLFAAVAAGILPVVLANRSLVRADPYETRYLLPVLPFAAVLVALGLDRLSAPRWRRAVCAVMAGVAGYRIVAGAFEAREEQRRMEQIGDRLRPLVRASAGITVVVVPDRWKLDASDMTPKATWRWSDPEARRAWVMPASRAEEAFGPRVACRVGRRIALAPEMMSTGRAGALDNLVWLSPWDRDVGPLEPYCVGPAAGALAAE